VDYTVDLDEPDPQLSALGVVQPGRRDLQGLADAQDELPVAARAALTGAAADAAPGVQVFDLAAPCSTIGPGPAMRLGHNIEPAEVHLRRFSGYRPDMAHLLVVEDDATIGGVLRSSLSAHGHEVMWAVTGAEALRVAADQVFDLVLLDLGLPDMDGVDVCRALRSGQPGAVVVVLTARDEEIDVVVGLEAGADDYLTKPFRLGELLARIHAHLRRSQPGKPTPATADGLLRVDEQTRRAYLGDVELVLRVKEFDLLSRFLASPGAALSRATLMADVWDPQWFGSTKTLDVHVSSLRAKLQAAAALADVGAPAIVAVRAFGYRFESGSEE